jgi:hypothetical protein
MDRLDHFRRYARDAKTPAELNKAIDELGPLPRFEQRGTLGGDIHGKDDIYDKGTAMEQAEAIYEYARRMGVRIQALFRELAEVQIPPPQSDPFLGMQTVQEWCVLADRVLLGARNKQAEVDSEKKPIGFLTEAQS